MKTPVIAFAGMVLLASGLLAQNQPLPGMPMAAPPLMASGSDGTSLGVIPAQNGNDIANRIKLRGYIDISYSDIDVDKGGDQGTFGVKSVDLDFLFDFSPVTAEIHIQNENSVDDDWAGVEQAFVTYAVNSNFNLTFGRQRQLLGFEGDEATDQYLSTRTYFLGDNYDLYKTEDLISTAYGGAAAVPATSTVLAALGDHPVQKAMSLVGKLHHQYNDGIRANFNAGRFGLSVGLYDGIWGSESEWVTDGFGDGEWGIDVQAAIVIVPGLEARVGYARHNEKDNGPDPDNIDQLNIWLSYQVGNLTLAGEFNDYDVLGIDGRSWMLMAHYSFTSRFAAAVRYSNENFDVFDTWKISVGPSIGITDNLLMRLEYSHAESDVYDLGTSGGDREVQMVTAEGLFTF